MSGPDDVIFEEDHRVGRFVFEWHAGRDVQRNVFHVRDHSEGATDEEWGAVYFAMVDALTRLPDFPWEAQPLASYFGREVTYFHTVLKYVLGSVIIRFLRFPVFFLSLLPVDHSPCLPGNSTFAVQWYNGGPGRSGIGRTYVPFLRNDLTAEGDRNRLTIENANGLVAALDRLILAVLQAGSYAGQFSLVTYHRDGLPGVTGPAKWSTGIRGARWTDLLMDSQRGRLPGHVHH